jgi:hypothetical protein
VRPAREPIAGEVGALLAECSDPEA